MTTEPTRRRVVAVTAAALAAGAALNAIAIARARASALDTPPLPAPDPDPVFAAIDEHRRIHAMQIACGKNEPKVGHPDLPAWQEKNYGAMIAEIDAVDALVATVPTTAAGLLAYLDYLVALPDVEDRDFLMAIIETTTEAAHSLIGGEVA